MNEGKILFIIYTTRVVLRFKVREWDPITYVASMHWSMIPFALRVMLQIEFWMIQEDLPNELNSNSSNS